SVLFQAFGVHLSAAQPECATARAFSGEENPVRIGICLFWLAVGAIFTFAVTANTSVFNLHIFGVVVMIVALIGLVTPRRGYEWLGRREAIAHTRQGGGTQVEERGHP